MKRAILVAVASVLVLAGCGASHAAKPTAAQLATEIRQDGGAWAHATVSCASIHACSISWKDGVFDKRSSWLGVFGEVLGVDADQRYASVRHFTVSIIDPRSGRIASFRCVLKHHIFRRGGMTYGWGHPCPGGVSRHT